MAQQTSVRLPDGSQRELEPGASAADLAAKIGPGLAKAAVAAEVNGQVVDLSRPLPDGAVDAHPDQEGPGGARCCATRPRT
jgi:threonyl-tRNA synthetase